MKSEIKDILRPIYYAITLKNKIKFTNSIKSLSKYEIGDWTYGIPNIRVWDKTCTLKIGKFCSIAGGVYIFLGGNHRSDWIAQYPFPAVFQNAKKNENYESSKGGVIIGNDVWIGHEALILSGVSIGDGAVIGARSVVTKNVEPYSIVAGNPAKHIKYRFSESEIKDLLTIAWWDWPLDKITQAYPLLLSPNIGDFINTYKQIPA